MTTAEIDTAMGSHDYLDRWTAMRDPAVTIKQNRRGAFDIDWQVRMAAALHPVGAGVGIDRGQGDRDWRVRAVAAIRSDMTSAQLSRARGDEDSRVREISRNFNKTADQMRDVIKKIDELAAKRAAEKRAAYLATITR